MRNIVTYTGQISGPASSLVSPAKEASSRNSTVLSVPLYIEGSEWPCSLPLWVTGNEWPTPGYRLNPRGSECGSTRASLDCRGNSWAWLAAEQGKWLSL